MLFYFNGPVEFEDGDKITTWSTYTCADSIKKARTNIKHQCRKKHNKPINMKVYLFAEIIEVDSETKLCKNEVTVEGPLAMTKDRFTEEEWNLLCKIFGLEYAESITLEKYILSTYGIRKENK